MLSGPLTSPQPRSPWVSAVCCVLIDAHPSFCPHQVVEHLESDLGVQVQRVSIHKMKYSFQIWSAMMSSQDSDGTVGDTWGHRGTLQCFFTSLQSHTGANSLLCISGHAAKRDPCAIASQHCWVGSTGLAALHHLPMHHLLLCSWKKLQCLQREMHAGLLLQEVCVWLQEAQCFTELLGDHGKPVWPLWELLKWLVGMSSHTLPAIGKHGEPCS